MRIAVVHNPPPGGARRAIAELNRHLALRHHLDIYQFGDPAPAGEANAAGTARLFPVYPHRRRRGAFAANHLLALSDLQAQEHEGRALARHIDAQGYDCALVTVCRGMYAPPVLRHLRTPSLYYCHEKPLRRFYEPMCRPQAGPMTTYERARATWQRPGQALVDIAIRVRDRAHVLAATLLAANSDATARRIRAVYGRTAEVCYLGVDGERFRPAARARAGLLSVGALEAHKGFDFVVRSVARLPRDQRPPLTIAGSSGHPRRPDHLQRLAERADVRLQLVTTAGSQATGSDRDLVSLYQASELFVFGAHQECFGLVLLEAMACGLPVVAVGEGAVPEVVDDGRTGLVVPRDEAAFARAIASLLGDADSRNAMGEAARRRALRWTWPAAACRLERLLEAVALRPAASRGAGVARCA